MTEKMEPRVVIADDHSGILDQVRVLLSPEFDVIATVREGMSALDCIRRLDPDIALLDLYMPGMSGLDIVRTVKEARLRTITVIMTGYNDPALAKAAITAGAMAFVSKSHLTRDLLPALRGAVQGTVFVSTSEPRVGR